ncbi:MAG: hypothetical protein LAO79_01465 [Acidobacteriia bacterium]|nr:hypothetical protein [Terriglobia bacterium]
MAGTTNKKVLIARFDRESLRGFVQTPGGFGADAVELLTPEGSIVSIPYSETKAVCFVRDFDGADSWREQRSFAARPKTPGLWVRLVFRDQDSMEGMIANNLLLVEPGGFSIIPPDPTFQNQRIFVPRAALADVQVLGVIGSPLRRKPAKKVEQEEGQLEMFGENG